jgi:hypothetical protein
MPVKLLDSNTIQPVNQNPRKYQTIVIKIAPVKKSRVIIFVVGIFFYEVKVFGQGAFEACIFSIVHILQTSKLHLVFLQLEGSGHEMAGKV